jgi:hypothetical protein
MGQKALVLLSDFPYIGCAVKIIKQRRKVGGSIATLCDCFWRKEEPWGVVQLPSGKRTAIPLASTDIPQKAMPVRKTKPQVDARKLLEMAVFCQQLPPPKKRGRRRKSH